MALFSAKSWFRGFIIPYLGQIKSILAAVYVRYIDVKTINNQQLVVSGGGNLDVMSAWSVRAPINLTATTTNPSKANTALRIRDFTQGRVVWDKEVQVMFAYAHSAATGSTAGSGPYLFSLPNGWQFDTTMHPPYNNTAATATEAVAAAYAIPNAICHLAADGYNATALIVPYSATQFRIFAFKGDAEGAWLGSGYYQLGYWTNLSWSGHFNCMRA